MNRVRVKTRRERRFAHGGYGGIIGNDGGGIDDDILTRGTGSMEMVGENFLYSLDLRGLLDGGMVGVMEGGHKFFARW